MAISSLIHPRTNHDRTSKSFPQIVLRCRLVGYMHIPVHRNSKRHNNLLGHSNPHYCHNYWHSLFSYRMERGIIMSKTLVATTQEIGGSVWATLDYAFQADSFEPYETLIIDETLMPSDEKKPVVEETHLLKATMPNEDKYTLEIICEQDITDEDEGFDDFLWRINLYKENLNDLMNEAEPKEYTQDLGSLIVDEQDVKEIEEDWYAWILKQAKDNCIEADGLFDEDGERV